MGIFNPHFDLNGPVVLPKTMAFYGQNDTSNQDLNPMQMVIDACIEASAIGVDFSKYDIDHDGIVDNVFIFYAGYNEAEGGGKNTIWAHRYFVDKNLTNFNKMSISPYTCTSELSIHTGAKIAGIGTFCHEFGHVLGLPDYYDTNDPKLYTIGDWNIMDSGCYLNSGATPPDYSAFDRFFLNWLKPKEIICSGDYSLSPITSADNAYLITLEGRANLVGSNPNPVEFFMLENRQKVGWDSFLPEHGMLITHVYYNVNDWTSNTINHPLAMSIDVVEADGLADKTTQSGDPFPGAQNIVCYNPVLRNGIDIGKPITEIKEMNGIISFKLKGGSHSIVDSINTDHLLIKAHEGDGIEVYLLN